MSWKNVKDRYRIGHIVQIRDGRIAIGSDYVFDLIVVELTGEVSWGRLGSSDNDDLARYYAEMTADLAKLRELVVAPDTFAVSLPVFTYDGAEIIEKKCEAYGYPNVTHDGRMMYDNSFFQAKADAVRAAKENARCGVEWRTSATAEAAKELASRKARLAEVEANLAKLLADYPENEPAAEPSIVHAQP